MPLLSTNNTGKKPVAAPLSAGPWVCSGKQVTSKDRISSGLWVVIWASGILRKTSKQDSNSIQDVLSIRVLVGRSSPWLSPMAPTHGATWVELGGIIVAMPTVSHYLSCPKAAT